MNQVAFAPIGCGTLVEGRWAGIAIEQIAWL